MIRSCLISRKELKDLIMASPQTRDGYYFCPRFKALVLQPGKERDSGFYYDRDVFKNKMCFSITSIKMLLARHEMDPKLADVDQIRWIDQKLDETLKGIEFLSLSDKVPNMDYTLEELIDTCIYWSKIKYE